MTKAILLLLICSTVALNQANPKHDELVPFDWKYHEAVFATLMVPRGFTEETENYLEGIVTYLKYPDGAYILLQRGGMWKTPLFDEPEYQVIEKKEEINEKKYVTRLIRKGANKNTGLFWREENTFMRPPVNIGFERVTKDRLDLFNKALDSFVDNTRKAQPKKSSDRSGGARFASSLVRRPSG